MNKRKFGLMDKNEAIYVYNQLNFISLQHFLDMSKKNAFSVVVKSLRKMDFQRANSATNVTFVVVSF
jgi:hypothetical protein